MSEADETLDEEQTRACSYLGAPVAIIAGAGTGKTRTLTHRIAYAAAQGELDPHATLAVTFTVAAADEMRSRLAQMGVESVQCRTFHSAALRQAQYFWPLAYGVNLPDIMEDTTALVRAACERTGLPATPASLAEVAQEVAWSKQSNVLAEDYVRLALDESRVTRAAPESVADAIVAYEEAKQAARVIDFDDVLLCAVALLATQRHIRVKVRDTYRHFLVDEFQDVSPIQARLLDLWLGERSDVCVVGDPAQTIHTFAGARPEYLVHFAAHHRGTTELNLTRNYRSTPQILAVANALNPRGLHLDATHEAGPEVTLAGQDTPDQERERVCRWLKELDRGGLAWSEMAVLTRTRAEAQHYGQELAENGIPVSRPSVVEPSAREGVHVGTLHAAKGKQWAAVCIVGAHEGGLPHPLATGPTRLAEERRLFYVGVTRAKTFLRVSWSERVNSRTVTRSRFVDEIAGAI
ncbi:MAG: ATP-dependent helicase [Propionibacteriaceae bacterium]|jgi:DNA helicase-2/ATP-dependent DNA helicase PcrA|nr:ATP-dependent helicase [Propionibacteriaceae bacterium]